MAVVPYSSDVLCTHKTRLQLLYTDVQQLKMVQMLVQSPDFAIYIYSSDAFTRLLEEMCDILFKISHKRKAAISAGAGGRRGGYRRNGLNYSSRHSLHRWNP